MSDDRLTLTTQSRLAARDYEAVFAHGGCFHFALRLHERFGYSVRGFRWIEGGPLTHVWARRDQETGIDIRGIYPEPLLAQLANGGKPTPPPENVPVEMVKAAILAKGFSAALENELNDLADRIVDTHERFGGAKPPDPAAHAAFLKDLGH